MFQTSPNHFLQSFEHDAVVFFMNLVSGLGLRLPLVMIIVVLMFGIHYKKGFIGLHVLVWTAILTNFFKNFFNLPRPLDVDNSLHIYGEVYNEPNQLFKNKGAEGFFEPLPEEVLNHYSTKKLSSNGFPSGHVSITTSFWLTLQLLFKKRWLFYFTISLIFLMPFSRMFLGQHFLADVLGGLVLGVLVVMAAYLMIMNPTSKQQFFDKAVFKIQKHLSFAIWTLYLLVLPFVVLLIPFTETGLPATLLGINSAFLLVAFRGFPEDKAIWYFRVLRVALTLALYVGFEMLFRELRVQDGNPSWNFSVIVIQNTLTWWLAVELNILLGWYKRIHPTN